MEFIEYATHFGIIERVAPVSIRNLTVLLLTMKAALKEEALSTAALVVCLASFPEMQLGNWFAIAQLRSFACLAICTKNDNFWLSPQRKYASGKFLSADRQRKVLRSGQSCDGWVFDFSVVIFVVVLTSVSCENCECLLWHIRHPSETK